MGDMMSPRLGGAIIGHMEYTTLLPEFTATKEQQLRATACLAWALAQDGQLRLSEEPGDEMKRRGLGRFTKAATMTTADDTFDSVPNRTAFLGQVDRLSLIGPLVAAGAVQIDLRETARIQVGTVVAETVAEGVTKAIMRMDFESPGVPLKVQASIVASDDLWRSVDQQTQAGLSRALVSATAARTDVEIVASLTSGSSTGVATPASVLAAISQGAPQSPVLIAGLDVLLGLEPGTVRDLQALGITILPRAAAAGKLIAIDARGLLISVDPVALSTARHATVETDGSPSSIVSLWQRNLTAVRSERMLRVAVRADAVAWSAAGSPA